MGAKESDVSFVDNNIEKAVIGACLHGASDAVNAMVESCITTEHFSNPDAACAFNTIMAMFERGEQIDLYTVASAVNENKDATASVKVFLTEACDSVASSAHVAGHCKALHLLFIKRETLRFSRDLLDATTISEQDAIIMQLQNLTTDFIGRRYENNMKPVSSFMNLASDELNRRINFAQSGQMSGITTGLCNLDNLTNGWQNSTLNIIAGRPAMGKTSVALHFALSAARSGKNVCIYSLEMSNIRLVDRLILSLADGLDSDAYRSGRMSASDIEKFQNAALLLKKLPIYIDDTAVCTTNYIRANAMKMKAQGKCDIVIIDYLQLTDMSSGANRNYNREQQVTKTSREFKVLANELDIPVLLLSQLSRAVETRGCKKPQLSDLRESGSIEQDADTVSFIYRPEYYGEEGYVIYDEHGNYLHGIAYIIVAKQRDGGNGEIPFCYNKSLTKISDSDSSDIYSVPDSPFPQQYRNDEELQLPY